MSASSKPPRRTWNAKEPSTEQVARALLDAQVFGDKRAATKHGVHRNTIANWRNEWGTAPAVIAEMDRLRAEVRQGWIDEARDARRMLVDKICELAARSTNLTQVVNALRRINEVVVADDILRDDDQPPGPDQPATPRTPESEGGSEGGGQAPTR